MAWLLFLDESGHDHKQMPYEVRGGVALQDSQLWPFTLAMQRLERDAFGCSLAEYQKELKGSTLLDKKRFKFANQAQPMAAGAPEALPRVPHEGVAKSGTNEQRVLRIWPGVHRDGPWHFSTSSRSQRGTVRERHSASY